MTLPSTTSPSKSLRLAPAVVVTALAACAMMGAATSSAHAAITTCSATGVTFAGGSGTTADPYLISNQAELQSLNTRAGSTSPAPYLACSYRQTQDIALTGNWDPIADGLWGRVFTGEYDGNGKTISGLSITSPAPNYSGLFGNTKGLIKDLFVTGSIDDSSAGNMGGLVGQADSGTLISNVHVNVDISGTSALGGLVGWGPEVGIEGSSAAGDVTGLSTTGRVGGLIGWAMGRNGYVPPYTSITDSYASGNVTAPAAATAVGGLVGYIDSNDDLRIVRSYATGAVTGGTSGSGTSGGLLAPLSSGSFTNLTVTGSFWDTQTTGKSTSADNLGTGKTTAEMKNISTFTGATWDIAEGWDASKTWGICEGVGYPFLTGQYSASPCPVPPAPTPTPTPTPEPGPSPTPDPGPTPGPSNAFTMKRPAAAGSTIRSTVTVPGPGAVVLRATRNANAAARVTACRATREVTRARSVVVTCRANAATRAAQRRGAERLSVTVTYTPTGGTARTSSVRTVTLKKLKPAFTG